jgi:hypothetical protein
VKVVFTHHVEEGGKLSRFLRFAVDAVGYGDETNALLTEQNLGEVAHLQIVSPDAAHVLDQNTADPSGIDVRHQTFPAGALKGAAGNAVIGVMPDVGETVLLCVLLQHGLLIDNAVAFTERILIVGEALIECSIALCLPDVVHRELLSGGQFVCDRFIVSQSCTVNKFFLMSLTTFSSSVSSASWLKQTLTR